MPIIKVVILLGQFTAVCAALEHEQFVSGGVGYQIIHVDLTQDQLNLHWKDTHNRAFKNFTQLRTYYEKQGQTLLFATNAGIYAQDFTPLGLHIEAGQTLRELNTAKPKDAVGNFSLFPNGIFLSNREQARVITTDAYFMEKTPAFTPDIATQSGPMLVINGKIHPRFIPHSDSKKIRSGVCVKQKVNVYFVISEVLVNFYDFARVFKDHLACEDALYLDGTLSQIYYKNQKYGAWFWQVRPYVGMFAVARKQHTSAISVNQPDTLPSNVQTANKE